MCTQQSLLRVPFSHTGHYCGQGCCLPGFVQATICIHLTHCQGRASSSGNSGVAPLQTLKRAGSTNPPFAQVLERAGDPNVVLDQCDRLLRSRDVHSQAPGRGRQSGMGLTEGLVCLTSYSACGSVKFAKVIWSGPSPAQACVGPLKPLPCHLPSLSVWMLKRNAPRGREGEGWEEKAFLPAGETAVPLPQFQLPKHPAIWCCRCLFGQGRGDFGFILGGFFLGHL